MMEFQWNLHQENLRRFEQMQSRQEDIMLQVATIAANTKEFPTVVSRVTDLEGSREKFKGGMAAVIFLSPILNWAISRVMGH